MRLAFCLFKYFPYSGLARDFLRIAHLCQQRGHSINVYTIQWRGDIPEGFNVTVIPVKHWQNYLCNKQFINKLKPLLDAGGFDLVMGFNKMPGLDLYYAADPCFVERTMGRGKGITVLLGRYRYYSFCERAVFGADSNTVSLLLSEMQQKCFKKCYQTPDERLYLMPPGIDKSRLRPDDADQIRVDFREKFGLSDQDKLTLMIGSAFKTKGLDRSIKALALLPEDLKQRTFLFVIGEGQYKPFERMAKRLGVSSNLRFLFGQDKVLPFLLGADCLLQPSYSETTGMAILEAIISGLPVIASENCGYAFHVNQAEMGRVVSSPFSVAEFSRMIEEVLTAPDRERWIANGVAYSKTEDLYSMTDRVIEVIEKLGKKH